MVSIFTYSRLSRSLPYLSDIVAQRVHKQRHCEHQRDAKADAADNDSSLSMVVVLKEVGSRLCAKGEHDEATADAVHGRSNSHAPIHHLEQHHST